MRFFVEMVDCVAHQGQRTTDLPCLTSMKSICRVSFGRRCSVVALYFRQECLCPVMLFSMLKLNRQKRHSDPGIPQKVYGSIDAICKCGPKNQFIPAPILRLLTIDCMSMFNESHSPALETDFVRHACNLNGIWTSGCSVYINNQRNTNCAMTIDKTYAGHKTTMRS